MRITKNLTSKTKRGDTIIEVMLAFAIFSLIAVVSIAMMNTGLATGERSLEIVTARNELNAQAEALRFIHSSYIAEATLPTCDEVETGEKCQQYAELWKAIVGEYGDNAMTTTSVSPEFTVDYPLDNCSKPYADHNRLLIANNAFIINTRRLLANGIETKYNQLDDAIIHATNENVFVEPTLNARIVYTNTTGQDDEDNNSFTTLGGSAMQQYTRIAKVEGIWIIPVAGPISRGNRPQYYDFYIETCWYGTNSPAPSALDAIIRLYNPEGA